MGDAIGDVLPLAFAIALSPIPIVAVVLVLGGDHPRAAGAAFALGWVAGLAAVSAIVVLVLGTDGASSGEEDGLSWLKIGAGIAFLLMAGQQWSKRPRASAEPKAPSWMATIETATPGRAAALGSALSGANPKNLALALTAAASIAEAGLGGADTAIALVVFVAVGSATVAGAVAFYLAVPERAAQPLDAIKTFMSDNNAVIMMVVLLLLGAKLLGDGLAVF